MDDTRLAIRCPRCGRPIDAAAADGLCASCLLEAAAAPPSTTVAGDAVTLLAPDPRASAGEAPGPRLRDGQTLGPYRIHRQLGRGGMGEVYEAEHLESGRRVALKVLRSRLHDAEDRARFLREGQLAASISHPHAVYIFGSDEIDGMPLISMELLPGGTLKDRVAADGPMPWPQAVDAVLDIIGGLDAAQAAGVLHRDIKPSNCFCDSDGRVKVGDFGLSISTLARDVQTGTSTGGFEGTPQFAAPEQLRGEPLDVRADIYAVGATLYYLLTGQPPFDASDLRTLVRRAATDAPRSPATIRPDLPSGLCAVVLRCLEKDARARPASYADLAEGLRPWSGAHVEPARPGLRLVAGVIDAIVVGLPMNLAGAWTITTGAVPPVGATTATLDLFTTPVAVAYYLLLEGLTGASLGKRLFGLRVAALSGRTSFRQVALRTMVFLSPSLIVLGPAALVGPDALRAWFAAHPAGGLALSLSSLLITAAFFLPARQSNGFAALHDRLSATRVIARRREIARERAAPGSEIARAAPLASGVPVPCGPFQIDGDFGSDGRARLMRGFDPVLRRPIWIRMSPEGSPPVTAVRRDIRRITRLHWLAGRRGAAETWDAFEAPDGASFADRVGDGVAWPVLKGWLADLARELAACERERETPMLALDRVWIRGDGHAVLLDFPAPAGRAARARRDPDTAPLTAVGLLAAVAQAALPGSARSGGAAPAAPVTPHLPLSAAALLDRLGRPGSLALDDVRDALAVAVGSADRVTRGRRALPLALAAAPAAILFLAGLGIVPVFRAAMTPEMFEVYALLADVDRGVAPATGAAEATTAADPERRRATEIYLAGRHRATLTDQTFWTSAVARGELQRLRATAARVAAAHPVVSPDELTWATGVLGETLDAYAREYQATAAPQIARASAFIAIALVGIGLGAACAGSLVSAAIVPGGLVMRLLGLSVVRADGREVSRGRSVWRAAVAWSPVLIWFAAMAGTSIAATLAAPAGPAIAAVVVVAVMGGGLAWGVADPTRGPVGRLTGTFVVPR